MLLLSFFISACNEQTIIDADQKNQFEIDTLQSKDLPQKTISNDFKSNSKTEINNYVLSILQDNKNNYWFGTNAGVYRYDGKSLIQFTTKDGLFQNQVRHIQEDATGNIWFSTGGYGVNRFNGQNITTLTIKENTATINLANNNWKLNPGDLWFCAGAGVFNYYNNSFTYLPFPKPDMDLKFVPKPANQASAYSVYSILKDRNGNLLLGTQAMGVCRFDGKSFTWFTEKGLRGPAVLALFEDRNGKLWFGNNGNGLFCYDGKTLTNVTAEKGLSNPEFIKSGKSGPGTLARVWALNEDINGNLWIGTGDAAVWRYDGNKLIQYTQKNGLPDAGIETIYKDKNAALWFGTNGSGMYNFNGFNFAKFKIQ